MFGLQNATLHTAQRERTDMAIIESVFSTYWELNFHREVYIYDTCIYIYIYNLLSFYLNSAYVEKSR